jgi:hypothetical protein
MRKYLRIFFLPLLLLTTACVRENLPTRFRVPEGTPVTLTIGFGAQAPVDVQVNTKAGATRADESRVHDLYVLIFDSGGTRSYGRYFSYQHKWDNTNPLNSNENENEGWYVENKTLDGVTPVVSDTRGAVKIATKALSSCTLVLLANVENTLISLGGEDPLEALNSVANYTDLKNLPVRLEQNAVARNGLFLMLGEIPNLDMTHMTWDKSGGASTGTFGTDYLVTLSPLDAKVKFRIRANDANIKDLTPYKWSVSNLPSSCYLYEREPYAFPSGEDHYYFDTDPIYFDEEETDGDGIWQTFTFYMLESCLASDTITPNYSSRELQAKNPAPVNYEDDHGDTQTIHYVNNGDGNGDKQWTYAPARAPFVTFSVSMAFKTDTPQGIDGLATQEYPWDNSNNPRPVGVTGETSYTVHLGDFSQDPSDYSTRRGHYYTYDIVINNASNLYAEVKSFHPDDPDHAGLEGQPGQEGALLLYSGGVVNCDAHYEYRSIEFSYNSVLAQQILNDQHVFSWYVKTPFSGNGGAPEWDSNLHRYIADSTEVDFLWVKFAINKLEDGTDPKQSTYSQNRIPYPGKDAYDYSWNPGDPGDVPVLMDINQLLNYIYYQYRLKAAHDDNPSEPEDTFDTQGMIRATAFVDEYYYERDPFTGQMNPDLWRKFINADPREMHILSDVQSSRDRQSNLINSSHSIIQRSIQTIYNVDSPELRSLWGTEHKDEMREKGDWTGWGWGIESDALLNTRVTSEENGRLNSVALWGLYPAPDGDHDQWTDFLKYDVVNSLPELKDETHRKMAYSCLTRNRDNNGDGFIDPEEIRWYMASINQLKGMWVGNESLSTTARLYQPWGTDWRAHVLSSTCSANAATPVGLVAEEGVATFNYSVEGYDWAEGGANAARLRESVRCIRNIGTYQVNGMNYDITAAPYTEIPDPYYTLEVNTDPEHPTDANFNTYILRFQRLDPRSLREYTDKELPFHDEKSSSNRIYLELHMQSPASRTTETPDYADAGSNKIFSGETGKIDTGTINETITNEGYNKYCPAGYRLPNQTELAIMTLVLPQTYWNNALRVPCRTYFSYGYYAAAGKQKTTEQYKLGWTYASNLHLPDRKNGPNTHETTRIRCVRDSDMTGTISGKMYLASRRIMPGETTTLHFNFSSTGAAFESGRLYLCYTDRSGQPVETEIPLAEQPSDLQYRTSQEFTAPGLYDLDPPAQDLPTPMQLKLVLTNVRENSETTFYAPFTLAEMSVYGEFEILPGHDEVQGFPISIYAETTSDETKITALRLEYKERVDEEWGTLHDLSTAAANKSEFERTVYFNPTPGHQPTSYYFRVVAATNGHTYTSARKSMEFLLEDDKCWNEEDPQNPWADASDVSQKWPGLSFPDLG